MNRRLPVRLLTLLALLAVAGLGACSSSSSIAAGTTTAVANAPTSDATTSAAAAAAPAPVASSATRASVATSVKGSTTTGRASGAASAAASPFCATIADILAMAPQTVNHANAEVMLTKVHDFFLQLGREAPPEMASDMAVLVEISTRQYELMARNDFDGDRAEADAEATAVMKASGDPAVVAASRHLAEYGRTVCGLDTTMLAP